MTHTAYEIVWLNNLLMELDFRQPGPMHMYCDDQSTIYIAQDLVFYERTEHIEVDCYSLEMLGLKK